jgi:hypothetical protein
VCLFGVTSVREENGVAPGQDKRSRTAAEAAQIADIGKVRNHESVQTFLDQGGSSTLQPRLIVHAEEFISANQHSAVAKDCVSVRNNSGKRQSAGLKFQAGGCLLLT